MRKQIFIPPIVVAVSFVIAGEVMTLVFSWSFFDAGLVSWAAFALSYLGTWWMLRETFWKKPLIDRD